MKHLSFSLIVSCSLLVSCSESTQLTRSEAAELIEAHFSKEGASYQLTNSGFKAGTEQGFWTKDNALTAKGAKVFARVDAQNVTPLSKVIFKIEATGMADAVNASGIKEVQYTLSNDGASGPVRRFIISGGIGKALFRRFDDGWRIETVEFKAAPKPLKLSASERQNLIQETAAEAERKQLLYDQAFTPQTKDEFVCNSTFPDGTPLKMIAVVSNVNVEFREIAPTRNIDRSSSVFYRDLSGLRIENFYGRSIKTLQTSRRFMKDCSNIDLIFNKISEESANWKEQWRGVDFSN